MLIIYDKNVNLKIKKLILDYKSLFNVPIFLLEDIFTEFLNNNYKTSNLIKIEDNKLINLLTNCISYYEYKFKEKYKSNVKKHWIIVDENFSPDNRKGIWIGNNLFLIVPIKNIFSVFNTYEQVANWLRRGLSYYIIKKILEDHNLRKVSYNQKYYDLNYIFEIFLSIPDEKDYCSFSNWWEFRGILFFKYIGKNINRIKELIVNQNLNDNFILFNKLILEYSSQFDFRKLEMNIGMCFHSEWFKKLNVICKNIDNNIHSIEVLLSNIYEDYHLINKYILITDSTINFCDSSIILTQTISNRDIVKFNSKKSKYNGFILTIEYNSLDFVLKILKNKEYTKLLQNCSHNTILFRKENEGNNEKINIKYI